MKILSSVVISLAMFLTGAPAKVVEYTLNIAAATASPAGKTVPVIRINNTLPGPTLRFREGDTARIHVVNGLRSGEVSTHWHGLLLPNSEDGVPYITTPPIHAGQSRTFEFPLTHSGTYWYHSHTGFQEQAGVYGSIVVEPKNGERIKTDKDAVVVLSDWTNENPHSVMRTLMRGSDWYAIRKGTAQSITGAAKAGHLREYFQREKSRMPPMDVSDVAYDAFLINGLPLSTLDARPGERVRLRVINASASTYFYLNSATGPLTIIGADGNDVRPIQQNRLLIGMAETYDLLFTVPGTGNSRSAERGGGSGAAGAWEFRASAMDGSGKASLFIGSGGDRHEAEPLEPLNPYSMDMSMSSMLDQIDESAPRNDRQALAAEKPRPLPPYGRLQSVRPTTLPKNAPVRKITVRLNGDMMRYLWTMNGTTLAEDSVIPVKRGEILRMELRNDSMMHHPMHLHGHFFRLLVEGGPDPAYAPLKHTVDVPPMSTRVVEFLANEEKDWAFHCHVLYHMHAGMMKVLSYDGQGENHKPLLDPADKDPFHFLFDGSLQSQMTMGFARLMNARNDYGVMWKAGWANLEPMMMEESGGSHGGHSARREDPPDVEYETDLLWMRYINPRWMTSAGYRLTNMMHDDENTAFAGFTYRLPYMADFSASVESNGDLRAGLAKSFQITSRLSLAARVEYDTAQDWMWMTGATWTLSQQFGLTASYDSDYGFGGGITFRF